ncbi:MULTISPECIES: YopX family protein [unclassified Mammaliicoccus]|uniref:YopX family protein n=1 Tax=unclassified Mammaliicoccus TaxID=2803851 RepID=UPI001EFB8BCF|nr:MULTISPECIES: YopX family protein [unclassified Mammaliicoccus]
MKTKFKFWDKDNNEFILFPHNIVLNIDGTAEGIEYEMPREGNVYNDITYFELLQSTGLFDKNGTEIFEGDILKVEYGDLLGETRETLIIAKNPFEYSMEEAKFLDFSYIVEIIGNRFEHPHLLGED